MNDSYIFELDIPTLIVIVSVIVALVVQLLLCYKVKRLFIRILPVVLFAVLTIAFYACCVSVGGWDGLGYLFFALLFLGLTAVCGVGWGVWAITRKKDA